MPSLRLWPSLPRQVQIIETGKAGQVSEGGDGVVAQVESGQRGEVSQALVYLLYYCYYDVNTITIVLDILLFCRYSVLRFVQRWSRPGNVIPSM